MSKRILVTGGAGFVGHHIIEVLLRETDFEVISLDRLDTSGTLSRLSHILELNPKWKSRLDVVWHDLKAPLNDYARLNLKETLKFFLYFSTDEVFGPAPEGVFYKEDDRYRSGNPYSASKAGAEELCMAYENTYKMPISISHTMNVFGNRQHPEKFIPLLIGNIRDGKKTYIHSNADCTVAGTRHYVDAKDVADAVLFLMDNGKVGEKYNIVGKEETNNLQLAQMISELMEKPLIYEMLDFHSSRPGHDLRYALCGEKMRSLGWEPRKDLKERLRDVISWSTENKQWLN